MTKSCYFRKKFCHASPVFKVLNILKIDNIYQIKLGKFIYQAFNGNISHKTDKDFIKLTSVHKHYTRHTSNKFHLPRVNTCYGHKMLSFTGVELWSKLHPDSKSLLSLKKVLKSLNYILWLSFKKHLKRKLLEKYDH